MPLNVDPHSGIMSARTSSQTRKLRRAALSAVAAVGGAAALSSWAGCGSSRDGFDLLDAGGAVEREAGALAEGGGKTACELAAEAPAGRRSSWSGAQPGSRPIPVMSRDDDPIASGFPL